MTIPLCPEHHDGKTGVHSMGRTEFEELHGFSEIDLLSIVQDRVGNKSSVTTNGETDV
jgi:hypothetical protein